MNNQRHSKFQAILIASVILLSMLGTSAMTPLVPAHGPVQVASSAQPALLQFSAGGHVLGFTAQGMFAATGSHALHVDFGGAKSVQPQSDIPAGIGGKVAALSKVTYPDLWPGITLTYAATQGSLYTTTYALVPEANARNIRLHYNAPLSLNKDGSLSIAFQTGTMNESAPLAWQEIRGSRVPVDVTFQISGQDVNFNLGSYNPGYALTIDPSLTWNTFLGAGGNDYGNGIIVDGSGNVYVTGTSDGTWGSPVRAYTGSADAFVAKLSSSGHLLWNTFLGGSADDHGNGITLDGSGYIYVTGDSNADWSCSPVPCTARAFVTPQDAFAVKLDSSGGMLWNSFLGYADTGYGVAVDGSGNVFVVGVSEAKFGGWGCSPVSCTVRAYSGHVDDAFVAKLNSSGVLIWNTFLGQDSLDFGKSIALDGSGNIYVAGYSNYSWGCSPASCTVRVFNINDYGVSFDAFVAKLDPSGNLLWNTFLGGNGLDIGYGIAADGSGNVYVTGISSGAWTCSPTACTVRDYTGGKDAFVAKLDSSGNLTWNTFMGGTGDDYSKNIALDVGGNIHIGGYSTAAWGSGPVRAYTGMEDAFVATLNSSGTLAWYTFLGGTGNDDIGGWGNHNDGPGLAMDASGNVYMVGNSDASWSCLPAACTVGAYNSNVDAFAAKMDSSGNLTWNSFLGSKSDDEGYGIAVDGGGNVYVTGYSTDSWGSPMRAFTGKKDAFAAKLNPSGSLLWNTFLGGSEDDRGYDLAVDGSGNVYVIGLSYAGWACSPAPCTVRPYTDGTDAFAVKLDSSGHLTWLTFVGGNGDDDGGTGIALDGSGNIYVTGSSSYTWGCSSASCTVRAFSGNADAFAAKLDSSGSLVWNTFLGGSGFDDGSGIAVDNGGNTYVTGSSDTTWGCSSTSCTVRDYTSGHDAFAAKLDSSGNLTWNTFLGGDQDDWGTGIAADGSGNVYVTGSSYSSWDCSPASCTVRPFNGSMDVFTAKLNTSGVMTWNTFLGGIGFDVSRGIAVDANGNVYLTGYSFATWGNPVQAFISNNDPFAAKVDSSGHLAWNTFLGWSGIWYDGAGIAVDGGGNAYVTGASFDTWGSSPVRPYTGGYDAFVVKLTAQSSVISGFAGNPGVTLSYTDGTARTVTSQADGSYSFTVSDNWSGTVTPSQPCYTFLPPSRTYSNVVTDQIDQSFLPLYSFNCTAVDISIGGMDQGSYAVMPGAISRQSYAGLNNGPVQVTSTTHTAGTNIIASERIAYTPDGGVTWPSYSELMGLPAGQLTTSYVMPWYNNVDLNSQLRFGNVGGSPTNVTVTVAGVVQGTYPLAPSQSARISYPGLNNGPVVVSSSGSVPIIASQRVAYYNGSAWTSFSELMGLPSGQLTTSYVMPWYNNVDLNSQLRFGNVGGTATTVTVKVAGVVQGTYNLLPSQSARVSYAGLNNGPVQITSSAGVPIIASQRVAYYNGSAWTSFSELMGLPAGQLTSSYAMPIYDNVSLNTQLRFGNVGSTSTTVTVTVGGAVQGTYLLAPSQSARVSYPGLNNGPVVVSSSGGVPIIVSDRVAYYSGSAWTSFSEMMGLPASQLTTSYVMPWYNNVDLNTQLRFAVP